MANSVDLVRAYLHLNGYFTVTEYPILQSGHSLGSHMVTDFDLLAFRFAGAGSGTVVGPTRTSVLQDDLDPELGCDPHQSDMLVAEVKEGRAELNRGARDPGVLKAALVRFGCCGASELDDVVGKLLRKGSSSTAHGHRIRMTAFGSSVPPGGVAGAHTAIALGHVVTYLQKYLRDNWGVVQYAQVTDPALGFLAMLEKSRRVP